ncbi:unnamed protein product, partial [Nesidiocoris tenuis]
MVDGDIVAERIVVITFSLVEDLIVGRNAADQQLFPIVGRRAHFAVERVTIIP